jgi:crotonobetainyl-CoA:carnitine CoA-transferase CaiB-like acyl-CoA transferase
MAGPFASLMLADLGADVVKVEAKGMGDVMRYMGGHQRGGMNAIFLGLNRGKRSVSVDLSAETGRRMVRHLVAGADVFLENFRPGVCASMGLGADDLRAVDPELIYVSISGYGPDSPAAGEPAYDTMVQGRSGMVARQKRGHRGQPDLVRSFLVDKVSAFFAVQGILAALFVRQRGEGGQAISVPMLDAALYYLWPDSMTDLAFVGEGVTAGTLFPLAISLTETADGHLTHLALSDKERAGVNRAVGRSDLNEDARFATTASVNTSENLREYQEAISEAFLALSTEVALQRLRAEGVPCSAVVEPAGILDDEHVVATGVLQEWDHPRAGRVRQPRFPVHLDRTPACTRTGAPELGQHNDEVLEEIGLTNRGNDV